MQQCFTAALQHLGPECTPCTISKHTDPGLFTSQEFMLTDSVLSELSACTGLEVSSFVSHGFSVSLCWKLHPIWMCHWVKKKTCSQSSDIIWSLLYTSGLSATHLGFHISPRFTCEAAERSGVKWHSSLQLYLLAATAKLAQRFSLQRSSCDYSVSSVEQQGQAGTPALQSILLFNLCWKGKERIIHPLVSDQCWHCRIKPKSCASNVKTRIRMRISKNIIHHTQRRTHRGREGRSAVLKVKFVLTTMKGSHFMINNFLSNHQHILSSSLNDVH